MDDQTTVDAPAAATDTQPTEATDSAQGGDVDEQLTAEAARKLRSEHKNLRERLKQAEAKLSEREKAELTEKERLEREAADAKQQVGGMETENRFLRAQVAAYKQGVREKFLDHIPKLIDWDTVDDPADSKQVGKAVREFLKENPEMVKTGNAADAGAGSARRANGSLDMNQWIRDRARK